MKYIFAVVRETTGAEDHMKKRLDYTTILY